MEGMFFALDAESGKPLWQFQTGGAIWSNPISYRAAGHQFVAIAAGSAIVVFGLAGPIEFGVLHFDMRHGSVLPK
jgi:alcohol dehydrogenase (cytochrome c)